MQADTAAAAKTTTTIAMVTATAETARTEPILAHLLAAE
jgi:hypothetical protein